MTTEDILRDAEVNSEDYYEALGVAQNGSCVVLQRRPEEMNINNYNKEWLKAWDGNMDIALCLDFFAVCTYITDYYTKTETKMMSTLQAAAKTCKDKDRMTQLRFMAKTFLTHRETGESEIIYRIMPHLHLAESNVKCVFVATGFPHNRSRMARKVKGKDSGYSEENENDEENMPHNRYVEIPGK